MTEEDARAGRLVKGQKSVASAISPLEKEPFGLAFDIGGGKSLLARAPSAEEQAKWLKVIGDFFRR